MKKTLIVLMLLGWMLPGRSPAQEGEPLIIRSRPVESEDTSASAVAGSKATSTVRRMILGVEYALVERQRTVPKVAAAIAEVGASAVKVYPDHVSWGEMQRSAKAKIYFGRLDRFVLEYQKAGFRHLTVPLKAHAKWAARQEHKGVYANPVPKPEYLGHYARWVAAVVERYDRDGTDDMPGLLRPVRTFEIGAELSAEEEPAPIGEYLEMLQVAYEAAHSASPDVMIAHAAFLTAGVFDANPADDELAMAFATAGRHVHHKLSAVRKVLDAHAFFDLVNLHCKGGPLEMERVVPWVRGELAARDADKPVMISDAWPNPFAGWGPTTTCTVDEDLMGVLVSPAVEEDRCALATYFQRLVDEDEGYEFWVQKYLAADLIKRVVIAAEQNVFLMHLALIHDMEDWQHKRFQAAHGNTAWAGLIDLDEKSIRPSYFALKQVTAKLGGYTQVERVGADDKRLRIYQVTNAKASFWVVWAETDQLVLPGDPPFAMEIDLPISSSNVIVERMVLRRGMISPPRKILQPHRGMVTIKITNNPAFVFSSY